VHEQFVAELEELVKANDPDAQHQLFIHTHSLAMRNYSMVELAKAELLLNASAAQGHAEALESLKNWPLLKAAALRRIARGPGA
jgi:hypothetical protein